MNKSKKILATITASMLTLGYALPVAAQSVYGEANTETQVTVGSGTGSSGGSGSASVDAVLNTGLGVGVKNVVNTIIGKPSDSKATSSGNGSTGSASGSASSDTSVSSNTTTDVATDLIFITRADVNAGAESVTIAPANVKTKAELSGYIASQIKADSNVSEIKASADNVAVTYKQKAKLLGFIPVTVNATAKVDAGGKVKVNYPWYSFLAVTNKADLEAKIQTKVNAALGGNTAVSGSSEAEATAKLTSDAQAKLVSEIKAVMESEYSASAAVDVSGTASVN